jgi:uncharacterized membrane protein (DUF485 family)
LTSSFLKAHNSAHQFLKRGLKMRRVQVSSKFRNIQPLFRAISVIASVAILVTGVTYAALQSQQATLTGNSIKSATADLQIGTSSTSFAASRTGFSFGGVVPGSSATPADGNSFYLKNGGTPALALKVAVSSTPVNLANVNLAKVYVVFTRVDTNTTQKLALASLISGYASGGVAMTDNLAGGATAQYKTQVSMDADAFTGQSADITGIDLVFSGTAVTQ